MLISRYKQTRPDEARRSFYRSEDRKLNGGSDDGEPPAAVNPAMTTSVPTSPTEFDHLRAAALTTQLQSLPRTIILHYSPLKSAWDWLILLLVIYIAVFTPYAAAFLSNEPRQDVDSTLFSSDPFVILDFVVDMMFMIDIVVNFRTTYLDSGELIVQPWKIAANYLKTWFLIDAVSAVPFDLILSLITGSGDVSAERVYGDFRFDSPE